MLKERSVKQEKVSIYNNLFSTLEEAKAALELYDDSNEADFLDESFSVAQNLETEVAFSEFKSKMSGEHDLNDVIL